MSGRGALRLGLALVAGALFGGPFFAAGKTTFDPEFGLLYGYNDNVGYGGDQTESDNFWRLDVRLPVKRSWRTGEYSFEYRPTLERYDTFDTLDRTDHRVFFDLDDKPDRKSRLQARMDAAVTQVQGIATGEDAADLFLSRRTDRQIFGGRVTYLRVFATKWRWGVGGDARLRRYDDIPDTSTGGNDSGVEDRDEYGIAFQLDRGTSASTYVGARVSHREFDLEFTGKSTTDALELTYSAEIGRRTSLVFTGGGFYSEGDAAGADGEIAGFQGSLRMTRRFENFNLGIQAIHAPSAGGSLRGAATDSFLLVSLASSNSRAPWFWRIAPRWAYRDPNAPTQASRQTWAFYGELARRITKQFRLQLRGNYTDQTSNDPAIAGREVWQTDVGFVWAPWRGTRMAGR